MINPRINKINPINKDFLIDIIPDGIGLFFLSGWFLSKSISKISLIIYTKLVTNENPMEPKRVRINLSGFNKSDEKKRGIKMKRFLTQLLIRINFRYFTITNMMF